MYKMWVRLVLMERHKIRTDKNTITKGAIRVALDELLAEGLIKEFRDTDEEIRYRHVVGSEDTTVV